MADSEARVDDAVDDPIDTDPFGVQPPHAVDETVVDEIAVDETADAGEADPRPDPDGRTFDAFNANTWNFKPAPAPWYRSKQSVLAMIAVSIAAIALVVSGVLLVLSGSPEDGDANVPAPDTSTAPTTETTVPETSDALPPPLPPPPPPPPPTASEIQRAPVYAPAPRSTKKPEQNVTRKPMSVSPQKPSGRQ